MATSLEALEQSYSGSHFAVFKFLLKQMRRVEEDKDSKVEYICDVDIQLSIAIHRYCQECLLNDEL